MPDRLSAWLSLTDGPVPPASTAATVVDGAACATRAALLDEWSRVLDVPDRDVLTWDALAATVRALTDDAPLTVEVARADRLLADEPPATLATFLRVLDGVAAEAPGTLRLVLRTPPERAAGLRARLAAAATLATR